MPHNICESYKALYIDIPGKEERKASLPLLVESSAKTSALLNSLILQQTCPALPLQ